MDIYNDTKKINLHETGTNMFSSIYKLFTQSGK